MDLKEFSKKMKETGGRIPQNAIEMKKQVALLIDRLVVMETPVKSGRARGNWQVGLGEAPTAVLETSDQSGGETLHKNESAILGASTGPIHLTNNVPYIEMLNAGSSAQAPAGYIENAIAGAVGSVSKLPPIGDEK